MIFSDRMQPAQRTFIFSLFSRRQSQTTGWLCGMHQGR
ncbi:hypothetical protein [Enterobacter hormaechei]|nr:hypothetical protein [Enterobacter hormaechei]